MTIRYQADIIIIGAGLAGICCALELLDSGKSILILDANPSEKFGGLANNAFGGMLFNQTQEQKRLFVKDSPDLMLADWLRAAEFSDDHYWQRQWAEAYVNRSTEEVYRWLKTKGISFFNVVQWVERGDFQPGNSVPRYHVAWGCGNGVVQTLIGHLKNHQNFNNCQIEFAHRVTQFEIQNRHLIGCIGENNSSQHAGEFRAEGEHCVVACGGINGNLQRVRKEWDPIYGQPPANLLNGSHPVCDGSLHDQIDAIGGKVSNLNWMWNYAAGIANPEPQFAQDGLALIPPRSSLWMDCHGRRVGPDPMIGSYDTHRLCKRLGHLPSQYGWLILNWKIAIKEMAISGSDMNPHFRDKKLLKILWGLVTGNHQLVQWMIDQCPDVVAGDSLSALALEMKRVAPDVRIDLAGMSEDIHRYDALIKQSRTYQIDEQIRRIEQARRWIGDRSRTCKFQPIDDPKAYPLIAIRTRLISRKSMGGVETDLHARVLSRPGEPIKGLYAIGEAAGFGGGGISGIRSLEGTFMSNCIFNGRIAAKYIAEYA